MAIEKDLIERAGCGQNRKSGSARGMGGNRRWQHLYDAPVPTQRDPSPSPEDIRVTRQIVEAGKLLDIELLDHLIIGNGRYISLKERNLGWD